MHKGARKTVRLCVTVLSTSGLWMCFVPQMYMQELTKQREMLYTVELVCYVPPIYHLTQTIDYDKRIDSQLTCTVTRTTLCGFVLHILFNPLSHSGTYVALF